MKQFFSKKENLKILYELTLVSMALFSVATIWHKSNLNPYITWSIWGIFFLDFIKRLTSAEDKWQFLKRNPFLIIAIIPLDAIFQLARFARLIHLFRLKVITKHFIKPIIQKLKKKRLVFLFPLVFGLVFLSVIPLYYFEPAIGSFQKAFLSSALSLVFFGSSSLAPTTIVGKAILTVLTVFGVMLHGLIISYAFDFVLDYIHSKKRSRLSTETEKDN